MFGLLPEEVCNSTHGYLGAAVPIIYLQKHALAMTARNTEMCKPDVLSP